MNLIPSHPDFTKSWAVVIVIHFFKGTFQVAKSCTVPGQHTFMRDHLLPSAPNIYQGSNYDTHGTSLNLLQVVREHWARLPKGQGPAPFAGHDALPCSACKEHGSALLCSKEHPALQCHMGYFGP